MPMPYCRSRATGIILVASLLAFVLRAGGTLHSYALDQATVNGQFPEVGTGISVTVPDGPPVLPPQTAIRPDGGTLFIVGRKGVLVVPAPP